MNTHKEVEISIKDHGVAINESIKRAKCTYCEKEVPSFHHLKQHLISCEKVSADVKNLLLKGNITNMRPLRELGKSATRKSATRRGRGLQSSAPRLMRSNASSSRPSGSSVAVIEGVPLPQMIDEEEIRDVERNIFIENHQHFKSALMGEADWSEFRVSSHDQIIKGILPQEVQQIQGYVESLLSFSDIGGCTIMVDSWSLKSNNERKIMSFLVSCEAGTFFLKSLEYTNGKRNVEWLLNTFAKVVEEVGAHRVVQIIIHDNSLYMQYAASELRTRCRSVSSSFCADHSINLMLGKIATMKPVEDALAKVKGFIDFIQSHMSLFDQIHTKKFSINSSRWEYIAIFTTLHQVISEKDNLRQIFNSPEWLSSRWANTTEGIYIRELLTVDPSFWTAASHVVKMTDPLIGARSKIYGEEMSPMGSLYECMCQAKEAVKAALAQTRMRVKVLKTYLLEVDVIWETYFERSHLHAAGYYLNPALHYSESLFFDNQIVDKDAMKCITRFARDSHEKTTLWDQYSRYKGKAGYFADVEVRAEAMSVQPVEWWRRHGKQFPELQRVAIRVLSQPCCGASRYKLDRGISEKLHFLNRIYTDEQELREMEYIHNNKLILQQQSLSK